MDVVDEEAEWVAEIRGEEGIDPDLGDAAEEGMLPDPLRTEPGREGSGGAAPAGGNALSNSLGEKLDIEGVDTFSKELFKLSESLLPVLCSTGTATGAVSSFPPSEESETEWNEETDAPAVCPFFAGSGVLR
jgi:hypothetical protein